MITVDSTLSTPPFEQIINQITEGSASGALPAHHKLPTVRELAAELGLAPNTVARAYKELEHSGVIETRGRHGSFVSGSAESSLKSARAAARSYVQTARALHMDDRQALALVQEALEGLSLG